MLAHLHSAVLLPQHRRLQKVAKTHLGAAALRSHSCWGKVPLGSRVPKDHPPCCSSPLLHTPSVFTDGHSLALPEMHCKLLDCSVATSELWPWCHRASHGWPVCLLLSQCLSGHVYHQEAGHCISSGCLQHAQARRTASGRWENRRQ